MKIITPATEIESEGSVGGGTPNNQHTTGSGSGAKVPPFVTITPRGANPNTKKT